jgi:bifunctional DNA-binding transcriptional regulator/antitoxin component of YhaV-PrlF toxin-antitoxin module
MNDFDYKKYSLEKLEEWIHDAVSCAEASPQEIYDTIKKVVDENYHIYKNHTERCYELLCLLNGNGIGHIQAYDDYVTDPRGNQVKVCNKDDPSTECKGAWDDFWEENYYPEEVKDDGMRPWGHSDMEYLIANKKDKVKKWILPVEETKVDETDETEYFVTFPDDLLEGANLKQGDGVEWVDQGDGSYLLKKVERGLPTYDQLMEKGYRTYEEAVADGWTMTADGFWIKEQQR